MHTSNEIKSMKIKITFNKCTKKHTLNYMINTTCGDVDFNTVEAAQEAVKTIMNMYMTQGYIDMSLL